MQEPITKGSVVPTVMGMARTPHKHAAIIKAWADGAQIESKYTNGEWYNVYVPAWLDDREYRVKPVPHKWQREMDALTSGKTIQLRSSTDSCGWRTCNWKSVINKHAQQTFDSPIYQFRIKPEVVVIAGKVVLNQGRAWCDAQFMKDTGQDNLKLTFEDNVLVKAEVLK
jgi:hypothetical protein